MPPKLSTILPVPAPSSADKNKKLNENEGGGDDEEIRGKKGKLSSIAGKRKRKGAIQAMEEEDLEAESADEFSIPPPTFDSETGVGERPTVSLLSLPRFLFNKKIPSSTNQHNFLTDASLPPPSSMNEGDQQACSPLKQEKKTASNEAVKKFWKLIDEQNYFQPFSKKSHRIDDLALKGGDYSKFYHLHLIETSFLFLFPFSFLSVLFFFLYL
jgi:hypothetical protein